MRKKYGIPDITGDTIDRTLQNTLLKSILQCPFRLFKSKVFEPEMFTREEIQIVINILIFTNNVDKSRIVGYSVK